MGEATLTVQKVAKILKRDSQTVRTLLQKGLVDWGIAYKLPNSKHYSYLIYAEKFYKAIGQDDKKDDLIEVKGLIGSIKTLYQKYYRLDGEEQAMIRVQLDKLEARLNEIEGW